VPTVSVLVSKIFDFPEAEKVLVNSFSSTKQNSDSQETSKFGEMVQKK
jgi:hypothetical protein